MSVANENTGLLTQAERNEQKKELRLCGGVTFFFICLFTAIILLTFAKSKKCPDCNDLCSLCDCPTLNATSSGLQSCVNCADCRNSKCDTFPHDVSQGVGWVFAGILIIVGILVVLFLCAMYN